MAIVVTSFTPQPEYFPYTGLPDVYIPETSQAKGEVIFKLADGSVAATGAGDNQAIDIDCLLPGDYGYVLIDLAFSINTTAIGGDVEWADDLMCWFQDDQGANGSRMFEYAVGLHAEGQSQSITDRPWKAYRPLNMPTMVVTGQPLLTIQALNRTAQTDLCQLNLYARFIQYTVTQQHHAQVNTPIPMR